MELINLLEVKTPYGFRQFKLVKGDISAIPFPIDLLVVSAFAKGYTAVPGTLIGALKKHKNIDLNELAVDPFIDLRSSQHAFFTRSIPNSLINRILCIEMLGTHKSIDEVLDSFLLSIFISEMKGLKVKSIMMPLLGTGLQGINPGLVLGGLLKRIEYLLSTSVNVQEVYLVAFTDEQAIQLNEAMNVQLKRSVSVFQKNQIISTVSSTIRQRISEHPVLFSVACFAELISVLSDNDINSFNLAIVGRKICEHILNTTLEDVQELELSKKIQQLRSMNTPPWVVNYFHMLRIYGNAYAHQQHDQPAHALHMNEHDIVIALFGIERVIEFYIAMAKHERTD